MRRTGIPYLIDATDNTAQEINRIPFKSLDIQESWLQELLHNSPDILPAGELEDANAPLISLGREIQNIDNLFVSPAGRITLVETKLWRNPQATREVVAQALDYASMLSKWSYEDLEAYAKDAMRPAPLQDQSIYELVKRADPNLTPDEPDFVDEVQRTLQTGRFLILIVGDGIKENLEGIIQPLHSQPQLLYKFGMVELKVFDFPGSDQRLVVPQLILNTQEIVRAVVRVASEGPVSVSVEVDDESTPGGNAKSRRTLSEAEFRDLADDEQTRSLLDRLQNFARDFGLKVVWRSNSVAFHLPDPEGSRQNLSIFYFTTSGEVWFGSLAGQLEKIGKNSDTARKMIRSMSNRFGIKPYKDSELSEAITSKEVERNYDFFVDIIKNTVEEIRK